MEHAELAQRALAAGSWEEARVAMLHGAGVRVRADGPPVQAVVMPDLAAFAIAKLEDMHSPIVTAAWAVLVRFAWEPERLQRHILGAVRRDPLVATDLAALAVRDPALHARYLALLGEGMEPATQLLCTRLAQALVEAKRAPSADVRKLFVEVARRSGRAGRELRYFLAQLPAE